MRIHEAILLDLRLGRFLVSPHALERMAQRNVTIADISNLGHGGKVSEQRNRRFKVSGEDLDGDSLTAIVLFDGDSVIVTVME